MERPPGIARIDGGIRLHDVFHQHPGLGANGAPDGTDDTACHGLPQAEGIADGQHLLPDPEVVRGSHGNHRQFTGRGIDLEHRQIAVGIRTDELGRVFLAAGEGDLKLSSIFNDVMIGEDVATLVDDGTRSSSLARYVIEKEIPFQHGAGDIDHAGRQPLVELDIVGFIISERQNRAGIKRHQPKTNANQQEITEPLEACAIPPLRKCWTSVGALGV